MIQGIDSYFSTERLSVLFLMSLSISRSIIYSLIKCIEGESIPSNSASSMDRQDPWKEEVLSQQSHVVPSSIVYVPG
jgi:hypothetical protein